MEGGHEQVEMRERFTLSPAYAQEGPSTEKVQAEKGAKVQAPGGRIEA